MVFVLRKDERLLADIRANLFEGFFGKWGRLKITNERVVFESSRKNLQKYELEISVTKIHKANITDIFGIIPKGVTIGLQSGEQYTFIVSKRQELMNLIGDCVENSIDKSLKEWIEEEELKMLK